MVLFASNIANLLTRLICSSVTGDIFEGSISVCSILNAFFDEFYTLKMVLVVFPSLVLVFDCSYLCTGSTKAL